MSKGQENDQKGTPLNTGVKQPVKCPHEYMVDPKEEEEEEEGGGAPSCT